MCMRVIWLIIFLFARRWLKLSGSVLVAGAMAMARARA